MSSKYARVTVLAAGAALVVGGWMLSRRYVAHGIADRAKMHPAASRTAISELAQLGPAALPALLDAAVNDDREVAEPARAEIELLLERSAASNPRAFESRGRQVLQGLIRREPRLTPSGRSWARRVGDTVLRLASRRAALDDLDLLAAAEQLYEITRQPSQYPDQPFRRRVVQASPALPEVSGVRLPEAVRSSPVIAQQPPEPEVTEKLSPPSALPPMPAEPSETLASPAAPLAAPEADPTPQPVSQPPSQDAVAHGPSSLPWRRPGEGKPVQSAEKDTTPVLPIDSRPPGQPAAFPTEVKTLLAGGDREKLRLVEQLLSGRHDNAAGLLMQLAKDPSARVRMSAISALGSSPNPRLAEAAYQLAIYDEDPRVARLASELQKLLR